MSQPTDKDSFFSVDEISLRLAWEDLCSSKQALKYTTSSISGADLLSFPSEINVRTKSCEIENFSTKMKILYNQVADAVKVHESSDGSTTDFLAACIDECHRIKTEEQEVLLRRKRKPMIPRRCKTILEEWFKNHLDSPYPNALELDDLVAKCNDPNVGHSQVKTWFSNFRYRHWKPALKSVIRQETLMDTGA